MKFTLPHSLPTCAASLVTEAPHDCDMHYPSNPPGDRNALRHALTPVCQKSPVTTPLSCARTPCNMHYPRSGRAEAERHRAPGGQSAQTEAQQVEKKLNNIVRPPPGIQAPFYIRILQVARLSRIDKKLYMYVSVHENMSYSIPPVLSQCEASDAETPRPLALSPTSRWKMPSRSALLSQTARAL
jgi:hypothetical protein